MIDHCKWVTFLEVPTNRGIQQMNFGSEGDIYRLVMSSKIAIRLHLLRHVGPYEQKLREAQFHWRHVLL